MLLSHRPMRVEDVPECLLLVRDGFAYPGAMRAHLADLWREQLTTGYAGAAVVEWREGPTARIASFGFCVFVTGEFAREAKSGALPYVGAEVIRRWRQGASPILDLDAVRRANTGCGLTMLVLNHGFEGTLGAADAGPLLDQTGRAFVATAEGYRLNEILSEVYGHAQLLGNLSGGFSLRTDYAEALTRQAPLHPSPEWAPYLVGFSREESRVNWGSAFASLFHTPEPRFFFRPSEQDLLRRALAGERDEGMAHATGVSLSAVKKRWAAVYECVSLADSRLLPVWAGDLGPRRGIEKRRSLLAYLRDHPEELRPLSARPRR